MAVNTDIRHVEPVLPESCRWCGIVYKDHGQRYVKSKGLHGWEAPTKEQIHARIRARTNKILRGES
jgi:hypothetical protein